jgi:hypothetical protein
MTMKPSLLALVALTLSVGASGWAKGGQLLILNPSFESPTQAMMGNASNNVIDSWVVPVGAPSFSAGVLAPNSTFLVPPIPNGTQVAYINGTGTFSQNLGIAVDPGNTYNLNFWVAPRKDLSGNEGWEVDLIALNGTTSTIIGSKTGTVMDGSATGFTQMSFTTVPVPVGTLGNLVIKFSGTTAGSSQVLFDAVSLNENDNVLSTPEPSTFVLAATGAMAGLGGLWRSRRRAATRGSR